MSRGESKSRREADYARGVASTCEAVCLKASEVMETTCLPLETCWRLPGFPG